MADVSPKIPDTVAPEESEATKAFYCAAESLAEMSRTVVCVGFS